MDIAFEDLSDTLRRISLTGRLDIVGTGEIETKFTALAAATAKRIVIDLTSVTFLASIGIRALISAAKAQQQRGGRVVLVVAGDSTVAKTLEVTGVDAILPMFTESASAEKAVLA
jgi:anti-sigma B factor antagonist